METAPLGLAGKGHKDESQRRMPSPWQTAAAAERQRPTLSELVDGSLRQGAARAVGVSAHADILEPQPLHLGAVQRVPPIKREPWRAHAAGHVPPVGVNELCPLGDQDKRLRLVGRLQHVVTSRTDACRCGLADSTASGS